MKLVGIARVKERPQHAGPAFHQHVRDPPPPEVGTPNVPTEAKGASWMTVTAQARLVDGTTRGGCEAAAGLVELRLRKRVIAVENLAAGVFGACIRQRGHDTIVMAVWSSSPMSSQVPDWMDETWANAVRVPATPALVRRGPAPRAWGAGGGARGTGR